MQLKKCEVLKDNVNKRVDKEMFTKDLSSKDIFFNEDSETCT